MKRFLSRSESVQFGVNSRLGYMGDLRLPEILFLHGFLGSKEDWDPLRAYLSHIPTRAIDLPGHGMRGISSDVVATVEKEVGQASLLVGYSAGGRLALELGARSPGQFQQIVLFSTNLGLQTEGEKKKRWLRDQKWIEMLQNNPMEVFLREWYKQPLFAPLKGHLHFKKMLERRKNNDPKQLAEFLQQFSVAKRAPVPISQNMLFVCGEADPEYRKMYRCLGASKQVIQVKKAGHALHLESPKACSEIVRKCVLGVLTNASSYLKRSC